jgi:hypothetical protein
MYFIFKTSYIFHGALFEKYIQSSGKLFMHNTGCYQNKVCIFGKIMAIVFITLASIRAHYLDCCPEHKEKIIGCTIGFDIIAIMLAYFMNLNAFIYILPLLIFEILIFV